MMQIYRGKFKSNGNCGYVLKPAVMWEGILEILFEDSNAEITVLCANIEGLEIGGHYTEGPLYFFRDA